MELDFLPDGSPDCPLIYRKNSSRHIAWISFLFFCSGFPALIYQIVWQRALFAIYGLNIESVTIVVSGFMLGLGLGSLVGGEGFRIADGSRQSSYLPLPSCSRGCLESSR